MENLIKMDDFSVFPYFWKHPYFGKLSCFLLGDCELFLGSSLWRLKNALQGSNTWVLKELDLTKISGSYELAHFKELDFHGPVIEIQESIENPRSSGLKKQKTKAFWVNFLDFGWSPRMMEIWEGLL